MKTLVYGMQCSGATYVTYYLAQYPCIAVCDLWCNEVAPPFKAVDPDIDIIVKAVVSTTVSLDEHVGSFNPDRLILVTRDIEPTVASLRAKTWQNDGGDVRQKAAIYVEILLKQLKTFDEIISYERIAASQWYPSRSMTDVLWFNWRHSQWCRNWYQKKWGFGGLQRKGALCLAG